MGGAFVHSNSRNVLCYFSFALDNVYHYMYYHYLRDGFQLEK